jgi:hypothetical protein
LLFAKDGFYLITWPLDTLKKIWWGFLHVFCRATTKRCSILEVSTHPRCSQWVLTSGTPCSSGITQH